MLEARVCQCPVAALWLKTRLNFTFFAEKTVLCLYKRNLSAGIVS